MSVVNGPRVQNGASPHSDSCLSMFSLINCIGTWPGPSIMVCTSCFQAILVSSPSVSSSPNCAASLASAMQPRSEEHTSELQSLMRISYAVFCLKTKNTKNRQQHTNIYH